MNESTSWMRPFLVWLLAVNLVLLTIHLGSFALFGHVPRQFYLDAEGNVPTWWSSTQLLLAGLCLAIVAIRNWAFRSSAVTLGFLALLLVFMSLDEASSSHERVGLVIDRVIGDRSETRFHHTGLWFALVGTPFAVLTVLLLRSLSTFLAEVPGARIRLLVGFGILLSGAVGVEALSNFVLPEDIPPGQKQLLGVYVLVAGVEEFLEMSGGSLLLWASFGVLRNHPSTRSMVEQVRT